MIIDLLCANCEIRGNEVGELTVGRMLDEEMELESLFILILESDL
jgi:hypothetical protein